MRAMITAVAVRVPQDRNNLSTHCGPIAGCTPIYLESKGGVRRRPADYRPRTLRTIHSSRMG